MVSQINHVSALITKRFVHVYYSCEVLSILRSIVIPSEYQAILNVGIVSIDYAT